MPICSLCCCDCECYCNVPGDCQEAEEVREGISDTEGARGPTGGSSRTLQGNLACLVLHVKLDRLWPLRIFL